MRRPMRATVLREDLNLSLSGNLIRLMSGIPFSVSIPIQCCTKTRTSILSGKLPAGLSGFSILFTFCLTHFCPETKLRFKQEFSQHFQMIVAILSGNLIAGCC